jgi:hypothetical protein
MNQCPSDLHPHETMRQARIEPQGISNLHEQLPRRQRHALQTNEPYLPRGYWRQQPGKGPKQSPPRVKTDYTETASEFRPGIRQVKKRPTSEIDVSPDVPRTRRRPEPHQRPTRRTAHESVTSRPHRLEKGPQPMVQLTYAQLQLVAREGRMPSFVPRHQTLARYPHPNMSRRARKRSRARDRRREYRESVDMTGHDLRAHASDLHPSRYSREQLLQINTTLTAATDQNASTNIATAHLVPLEPHPRIVPIKGVSAMGPATPTESSGWRKPESNHHSWFRNDYESKAPSSSRERGRLASW